MTIKSNYILLILALLAIVHTHGQSIDDINSLTMKKTLNKYGIQNLQAPEFDVPIWIDANGDKIDQIKLQDYNGKFKVIYCFQAWCPGCHSIGLPALQELVSALKDNDKIEFLAVQTVFEGSQTNTFERVKEIQKQYKLKIPFGHDVGTDKTKNISSIMYNYRTGGTPWFIFIDQENNVLFNDFHLNTKKAIKFLKTIK